MGTKDIVMLPTTKKDYHNFIVNFGIVSALILLEKLENLEFYEECQKIIKAIDSINKKALIYKHKMINNDLINDVIDDYIKMGLEDMDKEKLMERSERYASNFLSERTFIKG